MLKFYFTFPPKVVFCLIELSAFIEVSSKMCFSKAFLVQPKYFHVNIFFVFASISYPLSRNSPGYNIANINFAKIRKMIIMHLSLRNEHQLAYIT